MIDVLKDDTIIKMAGGRFKLTALMQKRWLELIQGARPLVDSTGKTALEVIVQEILEGKIAGQIAGPSPDEDEGSGEQG